MVGDSAAQSDEADASGALKAPDLAAPRALPSYDATESVRDVTMVDREVHSRAKAMREKDTLPPPRRSGFPPNRSSTIPPNRASAFPAAPPPPPATRAHEPPVVIHQVDDALSPPGLLPPPVAPRSAPPPASRPAPPASRPAPPTARPAPTNPPPANLGAPPPAHYAAPPPGQLAAAPQAHFASSAADTSPGHQIAAARSAATLVRPRPSLSPQALPSFAGALKQRVRFAGGEVPLWSLVTPLVLLVALGAAFAAAAVASADDPGATQAALKPTAEPSASAAPVSPTPAPPAPSPTPSASPDEKPKPLTLLERVASGDDARDQGTQREAAP